MRGSEGGERDRWSCRDLKAGLSGEEGGREGGSGSVSSSLLASGGMSGSSSFMSDSKEVLLSI